jgi:hypothetical protein
METFVVVIVIGVVVLFLTMAVSNAQTGEQMERRMLRQISKETDGMQKWLASGDTSGLSEKETAKIDSIISRGLSQVDKFEAQERAELEKIRVERAQHAKFNQSKYEQAKNLADESFSIWVSRMEQSGNCEINLDEVADYHLRCVADALSKSGIKFSGKMLIDSQWLQSVVSSHTSQFEMDPEVLERAAIDLTSSRFQKENVALQSAMRRMSESQFANSPAYIESSVAKFWYESYAHAFGET